MSTESSNRPTVRTYRGRSLEELIPRIRAELGAAAIILRGREGLTGINGLSAQRYDQPYVEVDAQAPAAVDLYGDSESTRPGGKPVGAGPSHSAAAEAAEHGVAEASEPRAPAPAAPVPTPPPLEELSFADRLAAARQNLKDSHPSSECMRAATLDAAAAGAIARELTVCGFSEGWAHELIGACAAHLTPFTTGGDLRTAVRAGLAASINAAPLPPSGGAAVAFVGSGGSGKTRCAAALAAAYARASTLRVSVISLRGGVQGSDAPTLLDGSGIPAQTLDADAVADAVAREREHGLVVLDTSATSPIDANGVGRLADQLTLLGLDAVYLTVPATLSASAARSLLDGLAPVQPSALAITHADESSELGIAVELSYLSGLPIAFIHAGLEVHSALSLADPARIAASVLP